MAGTGAYYLLSGRHRAHGQIFLRVGTIAGLLFSVAQVFPTGDIHGKYLAHYQPVTTAAMEGVFNTERGAPLIIMGQPDVERQRIDNPVRLNRVLSFLIYGTTSAEVRGLNEFPRENWPTNIPLLYFAYHIMAGLGTCFVAIMVVSAILLQRRRLAETRWMLWVLLLSVPFPYIANTAGWMAAEVGRQPWLVYGLLRTSEGFSHTVSAANGLFTLLGFMGLYALLSILVLYLVQLTVTRGPEPPPPEPSPAPVTGGNA